MIGGGIDSVRSKVTCLRDYSFTIDHQSFCDAVLDEFNRHYQVKTIPLLIDQSILQTEMVKAFYQELQARDWIFGQTPAFRHVVQDGLV